MSRRRRLLRRTLLFCSIPVVLATAYVLWRRSDTDAPYIAGQETEGITRALDRDPARDECPIRFTDVTDAAGVDFRHFPFRRTSQLPEDMGSGAAWGDYDGDDFPDLFLVNIAAPLGVPDDEMATSRRRPASGRRTAGTGPPGPTTTATATRTSSSPRGGTTSSGRTGATERSPT